jgi:uncharacterized membrane protein
VKASWPVWVLIILVLVATNPTAPELVQQLAYERQGRIEVANLDVIDQKLIDSIHKGAVMGVYNGSHIELLVCNVRYVAMDGRTRCYFGVLGRYTWIPWLDRD